MKSDVAFECIVFGIVSIGLGLLCNWVDPESARITFLVSVSGGGISLLGGILGWHRYRVRFWLMTVLAAMALGLLWQAISIWMSEKEGQLGARLVPPAAFVLFVFSIGLLHMLFKDKENLPD